MVVVYCAWADFSMDISVHVHSLLAIVGAAVVVRDTCSCSIASEVFSAASLPPADSQPLIEMEMSRRL